MNFVILYDFCKDRVIFNVLGKNHACLDTFLLDFTVLSGTIKETLGFDAF